MSGTSRKIATIDSAGTGQVMEAVRQTDSVLTALSDEPAGILRTGGLGVRDLRRLARAADVPEPAAAVLLEVAAAAGLLGESDPGLRSPERRPANPAHPRVRPVGRRVDRRTSGLGWPGPGSAWIASPA